MKIISFSMKLGFEQFKKKRKKKCVWMLIHMSLIYLSRLLDDIYLVVVLGKFLVFCALDLFVFM